MKTHLKKYCSASRWSRWLLACLLLPLTSFAQLPSTTLIECSGHDGGDITSRGFYIESYPGTTLDTVTLSLRTRVTSVPYQYQVGITVTQNSYNGPGVGFFFANATIGDTYVSVPIQCGNVPVTPGERLCFKFVINKQAGAPDLVYDVSGNTIGDKDAPECGIIQTEDTAAPLSTFRRHGVKCTVTGRRNLEIDPGESIQSAIDAAEIGDTITVKAGVYDESLTLRSGVDVKGDEGGGVILRSASGPAVTANDCANTEFSGFTVIPARASTSTTGFLISGGSPLIKNNTVRGFSSSGIRILGGSNAIICGNRILKNGDRANNIVDYGIVSLSSVVLLSGNLIEANEVGCYIAWHSSDGAQFINNTVVDNSRDGLWCYRSNPIVRNNIVTGNKPGISASFDNATPVLTYNNVWNNEGFGNYSSQQTGVINVGIGSISENPLFDSLSPGNYRLAALSPCIDAGDPSSLDNDLDGSRNDMGWTGGPCASPDVAPVAFGGFLFTSVGNIPTAYIGSDGLANVNLVDATALQIPAWKKAPFAAKPWIYGVFGSGISPVSYVIEHKLASDPATAYAALDHPLSKVRYRITSGGITTSRELIGPNLIGGVPHYDVTNNGGNTYWAHENLRLVLNSRRLVDGVYDFRVRAYIIFLGIRIPLTLSNADILTLNINNQRPEAEIISIAKNGRPPVGECAILGLASPTENLRFRINASHPDGFLDDYTLTATVGRNRVAGTIASDSYVAPNDATVSWIGVPDSTFSSSAAMAANRLDEWESCAYQFRLTAWSRATNGYGRVYRSTSFFNLALNLGGADLDGDGDR